MIWMSNPIPADLYYVKIYLKNIFRKILYQILVGFNLFLPFHCAKTFIYMIIYAPFHLTQVHYLLPKYGWILFVYTQWLLLYTFKYKWSQWHTRASQSVAAIYTLWNKYYYTLYGFKRDMRNVIITVIIQYNRKGMRNGKMRSLNTDTSDFWSVSCRRMDSCWNGFRRKLN